MFEPSTGPRPSHTLIRFAIGAAVLLGAIACGGGGGSSSLGGVAPLVYVGNTDPAVVTTENAGRLIADVIGSDDAVSILATRVDDGGEERRVRHQSFGDISRRLHRAVPRRALLEHLESAPERVEALSIPVDDTTYCDDGFVHTYGRLNNNGTGTLTVDYVHCTMGDATLNGRATLQIHVFDFGYYLPTDFTESFPRLSLTTPEFDGAIGGSFRYVTDIAGNRETVTANVVTLDPATSHMTKAEGLVMTDSYDNVLTPNSYVEEVHGRLFDSDHGFVDVTTSETLVFKSIEQDFPNPGGLSLAGAPGKAIRVTAVADTRVLPELDLDGDGLFEFWTTLLWSELDGSAPTDFLRPTVPVVAAAANADGSVTLTWSDSTDENGILEYRVFRGLTPIGRVTGTSLTDHEVEPGSIVDYRVRAVDNHGNLSDLVTAQTVALTSSGSADLGAPIVGTLTFSSGTGKNGIAVADVNADGSRDLVVSGGDPHGIDTALGPLSAGISFTASPVEFDASSNDANLPFFFITDLFGDSHPEALGRTTLLTRTAANDDWEVVANAHLTLDYIVYGDVNGDGFLDSIEYTRVGQPRFQVKLGNGDGTYDESSRRELRGLEGHAWDDVGPVVVTDVDRDGLADLVVWHGDKLQVVRQTRARSFVLGDALATINNRYFRAGLHVADVTGDGYPEVAFADYSSAIHELRVHVNDGTGSFADTPVDSGVIDPYYFVSGDLDGDQIPDLAVVRTNTFSLELYKSNGDGTFTSISTIDGGAAGFASPILADVDRDGDNDLTTAQFFNGTSVSVFLNQ